MSNIRLFILCIFVLLGFPAWASPPVPPPVSKEQALKDMERTLENKQEARKALEKDIKALSSEIKSNQSDLVKVSRSVQRVEGELLHLERDIEDNEKRKADLRARIENGRKHIGRLILALSRIERAPKEALILRSDQPLKTAQSAMVLQDITKDLQARGETLRNDLETLDTIAETLERDRDSVKRKLVSLEENRRKLAGFMADKQDLYALSKQDFDQYAKDIARISKQSGTMKELLNNLDKAKAPTPAVRPASFSVPTMFSGAAQLPVSGIIRVGYNQPDHLDTPSKGLWIEARGGSLVTSPMAGKVKFTGPFKGYGNLVILEHAKGYHSLVAGLEKIDTVVGARISAGEPLGILSPSIGGVKPQLYFELRRHGKVVNPSEKFAGIN